MKVNNISAKLPQKDSIFIETSEMEVKYYFHFISPLKQLKALLTLYRPNSFFHRFSGHNLR